MKRGKFVRGREKGQNELKVKNVLSVLWSGKKIEKIIVKHVFLTGSIGIPAISLLKKFVYSPHKS